MMQRALRRLADRLAVQSKPPQRLTVRICTIASITSGAAADGNNQIVVAYRGDQFPAPYLTGTYAVGQVVAVLFSDSSPLILGPRYGLPSF